VLHAVCARCPHPAGTTIGLRSPVDTGIAAGLVGPAAYSPSVWPTTSTPQATSVPAASGSVKILRPPSLAKLDVFGYQSTSVATSRRKLAMNAPHRPLRPISWWWLLVGIAAIGVAVWGSTWWLLAQVQGLDGAVEATARMDAIKTGLGVGAGTGGAVALLLAMRRQWLSERDQVHREQVAQQTQAHADRVAIATEHDANERRVTELYTKAADQLGSDKAPVRLAGLYALERLAQDNPSHRQTIVNLICAYLRMPYTEPPSPNIPSDSSPEESEKIMKVWLELCHADEHQVRKTAEEVLTGHLKPGDVATPDPRFWDGMHINLQGAFLISPDFSHCRVGDAEFSATTFRAGASFENAVFTGTAHFGGATIRGGAGFARASFLGGLFSFYNTSVGWYADFRETTFTEWVTFRGATTPEKGADSSLTEQGFPNPGFDLTAARVRNLRNEAIWPAGWRIEEAQSDGWSQLVRAPSPDSAPN